ncbi:MAG: polysaccharide deacetylase family protein [Janthinobacterium lividum]
MYQIQSFNGTALPEKTLCLTFDDGPGSHTIAIARFLFEKKIQATFFVVGKYAFHHPEILLELKQMKHLIGNHTYDHPDLPYYLSADGDVLDQVLRTDTLIKPYLDSERIYFRAPYGKWSAEVANNLNNSILTANHIGPIHWEIAGVDCYYWQNEWPVADAAARYLTDIERAGHGIIVMHDEIADMDVVKPRNKTLELLQILIPKLLNLGYNFVRLDDIPSIKEASTEKVIFTLRDVKGKYLSLKNEFEVWVDGQPNDPQNILQLTDLGYGKVALKTVNNLFLSATGNATYTVTANSSTIGEAETFDLIPVNKNSFMLRCTNGYFLTIENHKLSSKAQYMRQASIFKYANHNTAVKESITFKQKLSLYKKQFLFIKSKLKQKIS